MKVRRTYEIKLVPNKQQEKQLDQYFYEGKLLYNFILSQENLFDFNPCKTTSISKLDKDGNVVPVEIVTLSSKLRQSIYRSVCNSIKGLAAVKKKGRKVGKLKYKSNLKSISVDNQSYYIEDNYHIKLSGFGRKSIRCLGLHQLSDDISQITLCGSVLKKTPSGFIFYLSISKNEDVITTGGNIGIDTGIKDSLILSNGEKYKCVVEETARLKKIQRKMAKSRRLNGKKRTNNYRKLKLNLQKEYQKLDNRKLEFKRQMMHKLSQYNHIVFQDESLAGWKNLSGNRKTIQHSCLGSIKWELISRSESEKGRYICLDKWLPTTQHCPACGKKNKHDLDQRIYTCKCGYSADRDVHAAKNMLIFANLN